MGESFPRITYFRKIFPDAPYSTTTERTAETFFGRDFPSKNSRPCISNIRYFATFSVVDFFTEKIAVVESSPGFLTRSVRIIVAFESAPTVETV